MKKFNEYVNEHNIKKSEQLNEGISQDRMKEFRDKVSHMIKTWDEDLEEDEENRLQHNELVEEVGNIMDRLNLSTQDIRDVVAAYPDDYYIIDYVKPLIEYEDEQTSKDNEIDKFIRQTLGKHGVDVTDDSVNAVQEILTGIEKGKSSYGTFGNPWGGIPK